MNTKLIIGLTIAAGIGVLILQFFWLKKGREKYKDLFNNSFLVIATFLGVYLAVMFNDVEARQERVERAKRFIQITKNNLIRSGNLLLGICSSNDSVNLPSFFKINFDHIVPTNVIVDNFLAMEIISPETINALNNDLIRAKSILEELDNSKLSNKDFRMHADEYKEMTDYLLQYLKWEDEYQNGEFDEQTLIQYYQLEVNERMLKDANNKKLTILKSW